MGVDCYGAFVLQIADLQVEAFDLAVEQDGCSVRETDLLFLEGVSLVIMGEDRFRIQLLLRVHLGYTVELEEFLDTAITRSCLRTTVLDDSIFGLYFFEKMSYLGW